MPIWFVVLYGLLAQAPAIRLENGDFLAAGVSSQEPAGGWSGVFAIYSGTDDLPPLLGTYSASGGKLAFHPRFPLLPGIQYRAVLRIGPSPLEKAFEIPAAKNFAATRVAHIYPSASSLPENQLKLYIEFSGAMSRGYAWQHIRLLNSSGELVELPFLEVDQELWDPAYRRMTVLFDPGRIKRGLVPNENVGSAIEEGHDYTLVVDAGWLDSAGHRLAQESRKMFRVVAPERAGIDPSQWKVGAAREVTVEFPKPLDFALLSHAIRIVDATGNRVEGTEKIDRDETRWVFTPTSRLAPGNYQIVIDMALEDLSGNRIGRPFDVDVFGAGEERITRKTMSLPLRIGSK